MISVLSVNSFTYAQTDRIIDSLNREIASDMADTIKLQAKLNLVWYYRSRDNKKGIELGKKYLDQAIKMNYKRGIGWAYTHLGVVYAYGRNNPMAVENYIKALKVFEPLKDSAELPSIYNNLALVYSDQMNFDAALMYYEKSLAIKKAGNKKKGIAATLSNIGVLYGRQEKYEKASKLFKEALVLEKELGLARSIAESYQSLGNVACYTKKYNEAAMYYDSARVIYDEINDVENKAGLLSAVSELFSETNRPKEAIKYGLQAMEVVNKYNIDREGTYKALVMAYEKDGNLAEALNYQRKLMSFHDSIYNVELAENTSELQTKYETEKKEQEIKLLENENAFLNEKAEKRKLYIVFALGGGLILVILVLIIADYRRKQQRSEQEKDKAVFELQALMAQMNPHFIFNALNSIQHFILEKGKQEAYDYLAKFSKLVRMVLNNSEDKMVSLQKELELIGLYVELEQLRFNNGFEYQLKISENVNPENIELPTMLIQPYVENAIWHGLMNLKSERKGLLKIDISKANDKLKISIEDNGVGRKLAKQFRKDEMHKSKGMKLSERRLQMINAMKDYENTSVTIIDLPNDSGTKVEILL